MKDVNDAAFRSLFKEAFKKCFGISFAHPMSEADSRVMSNAILDQTGLVIGIKSIKNYSQYVAREEASKKENPSTATLDTLARYVLEAPHTDEIRRKDTESHYPYWFQYRSGLRIEEPSEYSLPKKRRLAKGIVTGITLALIFAALMYWITKDIRSGNEDFRDSFSDVSHLKLKSNGWQVDNPDSLWLPNTNVKKGHLTLYTLIGDNWPGASRSDKIRNMIVRPIEEECFSTEVHFTDFAPQSNWQQAGMLLGEDKSFTGKVIRLSISYNDFFGGYKKNPEVIIQGLSSTEAGAQSKPEEFVHLTLFTYEPGREELVQRNLHKSALKIEKKNKQIRFLYHTGTTDGFAFTEIASGNFNFDPKYVGLFAIQGLAEKERPIPVHVDEFSIMNIECHE